MSKCHCGHALCRPSYSIPSYVRENLYVLEAEIARGEDLIAAMHRTVAEGK